MKDLLGTCCLVLVGFIIYGMASFQFANPELTSTQLFLELRWDYLLIAGLTITAAWLKGWLKHE